MNKSDKLEKKGCGEMVKATTKAGKSLIVMMAIVMILSLTAACSSKNNEPERSAAPAGSGTESSGTAQQSEKPAPTEVFILTKVEAGTELPEDKLVADYITEQTNVIPNMIKPPAGTYDEKLNIMLASDEPLDAFIVTDWTEFQKKGMIRPINDLLDNNPELKAIYTKEEWDSVTDAKTGDIYAIPFANTSIGNAPRIRTDWLEAVGLPMPTTLEEFEAVLEAFKTSDKLPKNVIPLATHLSFNQLDRAFMGLWTKHGDLNWIDADGTVKPAILDPGYKDFIAKIAEWYKKGYIWKEAFSQEFTVINDLVAQNRVGVLGTWLSVGISGIETLMTTNPGAEYDYMRKFEGPAGSAYSLRLPSRQGVAISINSKNPDAVMKFFNWSVSSKENRNTIDFGLENKHWKWLDKDNSVIERIEGAEKQYSGIFSLVQGSLDLGSSDNSISGKLWSAAYAFIADPTLDLKKPGDYGVNYDEAKITETVPSASDIDKFRDKELVKFIMGARSLSEWDKFIQELLKLGLDKMIAERTAQYKAQQQ